MPAIFVFERSAAEKKKEWVVDKDEWKKKISIENFTNRMEKPSGLEIIRR